MPEPNVATDRLETVLLDGTRVRFRQIRPDDKQWLERGMAQMSPESRYRRFFSPLDHLTAEQLTYFTEVDQVEHVAWVATLPDEPGDPAIAVARFVRLPADHESAEAAVTVIDPYQGRGIGRALLMVLSEAAINLGVKRFSMFVLGQNENMLSLLRDAGAVQDSVHDGVYEMHVALPATTAEIDTSAAPKVLKVAASGHLHGEASPGLFGLHFRMGRK
ncbi:MAG TPA: GNAT family N-acetyltransferase [Candidatus Dormibacteraeota bacterium]|nr:GNAT family N-acetyltransferase [Candidatus Dormibacteraeota bacterium]